MMSASAEFEGMRWIKCDLHVHTPEDSRHWTDPALHISSPRIEGDLQAKAGQFLQRCHELELECIGVVDHNFSAESDPRNWFLTHLIEQNQSIAGSRNRRPLIIFPGFELDIRYHLLCLFNPVKNGHKLRHLGDTLTGMGLPVRSRFVDGLPRQPMQNGRCIALREVLEKVQEDLGGIVIAAHAFSNDGICNDAANITDFVENGRLHAVEVNSWPPPPKARRILEGTDPHWKRPAPHRQPAPIRGSDGKSLENPACANNAGCRYSWIKMSAPSIESLRQAFLDPESRICLDSQPQKVTHTHLRRIEISGSKFLRDSTVVLSPHLNCIIGGRGSGKSMLFESLRLGIRGDTMFRDLPENEHVAARQLSRLKKTFRKDIRIAIHAFHEEIADVFVVDNDATPARVESREVADAATVFRRLDALVFSQEEITQLAERQTSLLEFIDSLIGDRIAEPRNAAMEIIEQLRNARRTDTKIKRLDGELTILKQEVVELERQVSAKTTVQEELNKHRAARAAKHYLNGLAAKSAQIDARLTALADEVEAEPPPLGSRVDSFPDPAFFQQAETRISEAYHQLSRALKHASAALLESVSEATTNHPEWPKIQEAITAAETHFHNACAEKGFTAEEAEKLRETEQQHRVKRAAFQAKQSERDQAAKTMPNIPDLLQTLAECWQAETDTRQAALNAIARSDTMPRTKTGTPIVKTDLCFAGDREQFLKAWGELSPPRNTKAGRSWDRYARDGDGGNIGDALLDVFQDTLGQSEGEAKGIGNPVQWLERHWEDLEKWPAILLEYREDIARVRREKADQWFDLMLTRVPDAADLILLRDDDSEAGAFRRNDLSTGQRNTAILSLLLARGSGPVLIDQPEDELDSEFLFRDLVPMFRSAKQQRQLIIVTHNANIPVNADAELVYALKAEGGRGVCRTRGGLDRPEVTRAVLDIMEGSEEAFRRRQAKYHF